MTDNALKIIKDELARIEDARDNFSDGFVQVSAGNIGIRTKNGYFYPSDNDCEFIALAANEITRLTKALSVAVESLKHYDHQKIKATKTPCGTGEMHPLATDALTTIANILSGGGGGK